MSLLFAVGLFFILPVTIANFWKDSLGNSVMFVVVEKLIRVAIFLGYLWAISRLPDLRRVFEYHGAEHKVISCYEADDQLVPERAQLYSRLHMRCGTSFLLIVMILGVFVFAPIGRPALHWLILSRVLGIALVAGLAYEVIRWAGRNRTQALGARAHVAWPSAPEADDARAVARPARGFDRGAQGGARGRESRRSRARRTGSAWKSSPDGDILGLGGCAMIERLIEQIEQRYQELTEQLADPETIADRARYTGVARSHRELEQAHRLAEEYRRAESDAAGAEELLQGGNGELDAGERGELQQMVSTARRGWRSSRRTSGSRCSRRTRTTRRT